MQPDTGAALKTSATGAHVGRMPWQNFAAFVELIHLRLTGPRTSIRVPETLL